DEFSSLFKYFHEEILLRIKSNKNDSYKEDTIMNPFIRDQIVNFENSLKKKQSEILYLKSLIERRNKKIEELRKNYYIEIGLLREQLLKFDQNIAIPEFINLHDTEDEEINFND